LQTASTWKVVTFVEMKQRQKKNHYITAFLQLQAYNTKKEKKFRECSVRQEDRKSQFVQTL
jgi:hypothetical protein